MKFYQSLGPNPRVVRMFLLEKQFDIPTEEVDIMSGENRKSDYLNINPTGQSPALETDEGQVITEITAICEYLEEIKSDPVLIGSTPLERANTRMWCRRIDLNIVEPMANGFRFAEGLAFFKERLHCIPQAADDLKATARKNLAWLNDMMADKEYIANDKFSLADILLYCFLDFANRVGQPLSDENTHLAAWFQRINSRPSAKDSIHPSEP